MTVMADGVRQETIVAYTDVTSYGPLQNSWVDYGGAYAKVGWTKDAQGVVHLKGLCKDGVTASGTLIFKLPVGYRPSETHLFVVSTYDGTTLKHGRIDVTEAGDVLARDVESDWLSLCALSFLAAPV